MKKTFSLLFFIVLVGTVIFFGSPYYTAYQLKNAYDIGDGESLVNHVDFYQLQPNIQSQLTTRFDDTLSQYPLVQQLGGDALSDTASMFIGQAVNEAVTAENFSSIVSTQGQINEATKKLAAAWAIASNKVDLQRLIQDMIAQQGDIDTVIENQISMMMQQQAQQLAAQEASGSNADPQLTYCGIDCFTISGYVRGYPVVLQMERQGLIEWKIVDVKLP